MTITISGKGPGMVARRIRNIGDRAENVSPVWPKVGTYLRRQVKRQFATKGANFGRTWKPLTPGYAAWKRRHFPGKPILVQYGTMKDSFTELYAWGHIEDYFNDHMIFGSGLQESVWHQYGTHRNGKRAVPPRPMLVITGAVRKHIRDQVAAYVLNRSVKSVSGGE